MRGRDALLRSFPPSIIYHVQGFLMLKGHKRTYCGFIINMCIYIACTYIHIHTHTYKKYVHLYCSFMHTHTHLCSASNQTPSVEPAQIMKFSVRIYRGKAFTSTWITHLSSAGNAHTHTHTFMHTQTCSMPNECSKGVLFQVHLVHLKIEIDL